MDFTSHPKTGKYIFCFAVIFSLIWFYQSVSGSYVLWRRSRLQLIRFEKKNSFKLSRHSVQKINKKVFLSSKNVQNFLQSVIVFCRDNQLKLVSLKPTQKRDSIALSLHILGSKKHLIHALNVLQSSSLVFQVDHIQMYVNHNPSLNMKFTVPLLKTGSFETLNSLGSLRSTVLVKTKPVDEVQLGWLSFGRRKWELILSGRKYFWSES